MIPLRPYQSETIDKLREAIRVHGRVILCSQTGSGKTRMAKWILDRALSREPNGRQSGRMLVAVHRRGLVDNMSDELLREPAVPHGMIMSGVDTRAAMRVQCASIDSLNSWYVGEEYSGPTFDLVIYDETHSHLSKLKTFLESHDPKRESEGKTPTIVIGLTATPECKGLADVFNHIVHGPSPSWLQEHGYAARYRYMTGRKGDLGRLVKKGGEYTQTSVADAMDGLAGDFVRDWKKYADGRPTIGFFPRLAHAREAQEILIGAGIDARYVDGKTPDDERHELFGGLDNGDYQYLCNVGVTERGTDIPAVSCTQLCTAIGRPSRYLQMIGRGSRILTIGKTDCLVLDHGENVVRHGFWEDDRDWPLDTSTKESTDSEARAVIECPSCGAVYRGGLCRLCGYEPSAEERKQKGLVFDGGELKEITRKDRTEPKKKSCEDLLISALYMAGRSGRTWKQACGIAYGMAAKQNTKMRVPREFQVGGRKYRSVPYGHPDGTRRVSQLFDFVS